MRYILIFLLVFVVSLGHAADDGNSGTSEGAKSTLNNSENDKSFGDDWQPSNQVIDLSSENLSDLRSWLLGNKIGFKTEGQKLLWDIALSTDFGNAPDSSCLNIMKRLVYYVVANELSKSEFERYRPQVSRLRQMIQHIGVPTFETFIFDMLFSESGLYQEIQEEIAKKDQHLQREMIRHFFCNSGDESKLTEVVSNVLYRTLEQFLETPLDRIAKEKLTFACEWWLKTVRHKNWLPSLCATQMAIFEKLKEPRHLETLSLLPYIVVDFFLAQGVPVPLKKLSQVQLASIIDTYKTQLAARASADEFLTTINYHSTELEMIDETGAPFWFRFFVHIEHEEITLSVLHLGVGINHKMMLTSIADLLAVDSNGKNIFQLLLMLNEQQYFVWDALFEALKDSWDKNRQTTSTASFFGRLFIEEQSIIYTPLTGEENSDSLISRVRERIINMLKTQNDDSISPDVFEKFINKEIVEKRDLSTCGAKRANFGPNDEDRPAKKKPE